ncbi:class C sortase [Enterococcus faecium]|uniref:class C sortase n=1 Tax=Enterococcus faecium TaxID=1352 RepID=UPI0018A96636|nr:class C sortase [Enterococcus faecium]MDB7358492.1 class C sortase [Enterococcus faecium]MDB7376603.1 class C sortase [Enterococcus faecium]MDB7379381.1 class C sortase [Enterococcus faecium]MDB7384386.1 class C sortase [Enterococcus faecium]MDB7387051.1 class C sortase [Enterococcus faecium]
MKQRKQKQSRRLLFRLFLLICIVVGLLIALYPFYVDSLNSLMDQKRMEQVKKRTAAENEAQRKKMEEQNQRLTDQGFNPGADPFDEQNRNESTTSGQLEEWLIGSINIPKIQINISLYDRLNGMILENGAGVLQGTSFPLGGNSTHSVISAHSGLPNRRLFTELDRLEHGDTFILTVLGEKLAYQVGNIQVVLPDDTSVLTIEEGKDLVTLLTCTPYMINTHRLLVTGHRIPYSESVKNEEEKGNQERTLRQLLILAGTIIAVVILLLFIGRLIYQYRLSKKVLDFSFIISDSAGNPVKGGSFILKHKKKTLTRNGVPFSVQSDHYGKVKLDQLPGGTYRIVSVDDPKVAASFGIRKLKQEKMYFFEGRKLVKELQKNGFWFKLND